MNFSLIFFFGKERRKELFFFFILFLFQMASSGESILLPINEARQYKFLELQNGLKVVIIRDGEAEKYSACLSVCVGSNADPGMTFFQMPIFRGYLIFFSLDLSFLDWTS